MFPIAASLGWEPSPERQSDCADLLAAAPHRFAGAAHIAPVPLGAIGFRTARSGPTGDAVWMDPDARFAVLADSRLHNRAQLAAALDLEPDSVSDAHLIGCAYRRWRRDFVNHLVGDFAVVVCDWGREEIILVTGPNIARMLYYTAHHGGFLIAGDPEQIRSARRFRLSDVEPETVWDYLSSWYRDPARTFYRNLLRVPPGFQVVLSRRGSMTSRFFLPPRNLTVLDSTGDYFREFGRLFRLAVADAVDPGARHFVHLSGGLDTSSIAGALGELFPDAGTRFDLITGTFPTIPVCDEAVAASTIAATLRFPARTWNAEKLPDFQRELDLSVWPIGVVPMAIANFQDLDIAGDEGAVAVLTGDAGDGLTTEVAVFEDLLRHRRWGLLRDQLVAKGLRPPTRGIVLRRLLRQMARPLASRIKRAFGKAVPPWAGPAIRQISRSSTPGGPAPEQGHLRDMVQRQCWTALTDPRDLWVYETMQLRAVRAGIELRSPYRDQRLLTFVASIPFEHRLPNGTSRRLQREGLADLIPLGIRQAPKMAFEPAVHALLAREDVALRTTFGDGTWLSAAYVDLDQARRLLRIDTEGNRKARQLLRRVWTLELWLRRQMV